MRLMATAVRNIPLHRARFSLVLIALCWPVVYDVEKTFSDKSTNGHT